MLHLINDKGTHSSMQTNLLLPSLILQIWPRQRSNLTKNRSWNSPWSTWRRPKRYWSTLPVQVKTSPKSSSSLSCTTRPPFTRNYGNSTTAQTISRESSSTTKTSSVKPPSRGAPSARNLLAHPRIPPKSKWNRSCPDSTFNSVRSVLSSATTMLPFSQLPRLTP